MTPQQFISMLQQYAPEISQAVNRTLPVKIGAIGKKFFQDNFRKGGFQDYGLHPWQRTHRQRYAKGAAAQYKPLMSGRQNLYGSIAYTPATARVAIGTDVPYAEIHNEGGDIVVTPRMKRFFWAKYREANGGTWKRKTTEADFWKALALKPVGSTLHIPKRQFIGESRELNDKIQQTIEDTINKIIQQ